MDRNISFRLEELYKRYNIRAYVHPDPLEFLYNYNELRDIEIVGLIASSLAYGRVAQILKAVEKILAIMSASPYEYINGTAEKKIARDILPFKHRLTTGEEMRDLVLGIKKVLKQYGSLNACFTEGLRIYGDDFMAAQTHFVESLGGKDVKSSLLPWPPRGSPCKRLNLYLRWMARSDAVDPGGWKGVSASQLIIPLDTHMFKISRALGFTRRNQADLKTALEITSAFKQICPEDPVKYDFCLTRLGIRSDTDMRAFLADIR